MLLAAAGFIVADHKIVPQRANFERIIVVVFDYCRGGWKQFDKIYRVWSTSCNQVSTVTAGAIQVQADATIRLVRSDSCRRR